MRTAAFATLLCSSLALADEPVRADLHVHLTMDHALSPLFRGESGKGHLAATPDAVWLNQVDADQLLHAGVRVVVASVWPPPATRAGRTKRDAALRELDALRAFAADHPEVRFASSAADAREALAQGQVALIPAVEGGEGIQSPEDVDLYYQHGARLMTVVHILDCDLGGSAKGQVSRTLGMWAEGERNAEGLSELGKATVRRMIQLGMVVDLAHASDAAANDMLTLTEAAHVPAVDTHSASRAYLDIERNLPDALARRIGAAGGMIGTTLCRPFLQKVPAADQWAGFEAGTCDEVVAHWKHFAGLVGPQSVVLGSDFNGMVKRPVAGGSCPRGIRSTEDLPDLYAALAAHGVPRAALDGGGLRFLKLVEQVEAKADPAAQAQAMSRRGGISSSLDVGL